MARNLPPIGTGGARPGAGRKPSEFLEKCRNVASNPKYFKWAERVLSDEPTEERVYGDGQIIKVRASAGEKDRVWSTLAAYGFGKPLQALEVSGAVAVSLTTMVEKAESERGLKGKT